jgi:hypothetical protein
MASNYDAKLNFHRHVRYNTGGPDYETLANTPIEDSLTKEEWIDVAKWQNSKSRCITTFLATAIPAQYVLGQVPAFKLLNGKMRGLIRFGVPFIGMLLIDYTFESERKNKIHDFHMRKLNSAYVNPVSDKFKF